MAGSTGVAVGVGVGLAVRVGLGDGVTVGVGLDEALELGVADGELGPFVDPEHPATVRPTPTASARAAGRASALVGFTTLGYRAFMWRARAATRLRSHRYRMVISRSGRKVCAVGAAPGARAAGEFGAWLGGFRASLGTGADAEVPCDGCTACCRSGKLIPVEPDETDALAHIPSDRLLPMPGEGGRLVLRHDTDGTCSQLVDGRCTVYAHRPRACRAYDCRIFLAAGVRPDSPLIAERAGQWQFTYASDAAHERHDAVRMAAVVLGFPGGLSAPASPTQHALDAINAG
jgi:uncharacterized protein